jgi:pimeloyl-ACP methyl ester carboxylesterase
MNPEVRQVEHRGRSVAVWVFGSGPSTLLCAHGLSGFAFDWWRTADALGDGWTVYSVDLPGFGRSDIDPAHMYGPDHMALVLQAVRDAFNLEAVTFAGHSYGGRAAYLATLDRPGTARGVIVVDSGPEPGPGSAAIRSRIGSWREDFDTREAARATYRELYAGEPEDWFERRMSEYLMDLPDGRVRIRRDPWWRETWAQGTGARSATWDEWRSVSVPTLLLRGKRSTMLTVEAATRMAHENQQVVLVEIPDAGHNLLLEAPDEVAKAVQLFASMKMG